MLVGLEGDGAGAVHANAINNGTWRKENGCMGAKFGIEALAKA
jgi:hypothetical protein